MINKVLEEIFSFRNVKDKKNLDDLKKLYENLGSPCKNSKILHIAGTNGKGSTATFIEKILIEAGYNVGKFTSPHILLFNERIVFNDEMIPNDEIVELYEKLVKKIEKQDLSFFEITFLIALLYFNSKENLDFLVIETGLGGRLDATNILKSEVAIITNVTFDHVNILGDTLEKISKEKAGIIKDGQLCLYAQNLLELETEIKKKTDKYVNVLEKYNYEICLNKEKILTNIKLENNSFEIPLFGKFQGENFLLAYEVAKLYNISDNIIKKALTKIKWSGRFEIFCENPMTILDVAHNEDSMDKLCDNLMNLYEKDEIVVITSILETKDCSKIISSLQKVTNRIIVTSLEEIMYGLNSNRIKEKLILANVDTSNLIFEDDIKKAYEYAKKLIDDKYKAVVICGSFYEIAEFKKKINSI